MTPMDAPVAAGSSEQDIEITELSLQELMSLDLVVTTATKKAQKLSDTASAVYVLTNDDIRRSGATNLPDALRLVPGVQVARITAHKWAVSIRGFNSQFAAKIQVLIDGRSIYSHLNAGVVWDIHNPMLEDIDRIEIIRGPGASLWGANAVNGVINIITKDAMPPEAICWWPAAATKTGCSRLSVTAAKSMTNPLIGSMPVISTAPRAHRWTTAKPMIARVACRPASERTCS